MVQLTKLKTDIRIARLRRRERQAFGSRIEVGGDMYQAHIDFLEWASAYDTGDINMRSRQKHDVWQNFLPCKKITLNGADTLDYNFAQVKAFL